MCGCGPPPGATSAGSRCTLFSKLVLLVKDSAALESTCSRMGTALPRSLANASTPRRFSGGAVASVQFRFGLCFFIRALIRCFPCKIMLLTDFIGCLSLAQSASARACKALPATQTDTQLVAFQRRTDPLSSCSSRLVRPAETSLSTVSRW